MLQDLHAHTFYSFCGKDTPEAIVEAAIAAGLDLFAITDHNYGIGYSCLDLFHAASDTVPDLTRPLRRYHNHINLVREAYADRITVLRGIEICTLADEAHLGYALPEDADISCFDFCLIENLDDPRSLTRGDLFAYARRCATPMVGVAHTDLFAHIAHLNLDPEAYFRRMADENIFWEMNVSYDSIHGYREHRYMLDFFANPEQQAIVRRSGVRVSIGFDGHKVEDYLPDRVTDYCRRLTAMGIKMPFEA